MLEVSPNRSDQDFEILDSYNVNWNLSLPFKKNEPWRVSQAYDERGGSHNGYTSFCFDFERSDLGSSEGVALVSAARGRVAIVCEDSPAQGERGNYINIKFQEGAFYGYLHIQQNSFRNFSFARVPQPHPGWLRPFVGIDQEVARLGDTSTPNNPHLHFGVSNIPDVTPGQKLGLVTLPVAFSNYYGLEGNNWSYVPLGVPKSGEVIMRKS